MLLINLICLIPFVSADFANPSLDDVKKGCNVFNSGPCQGKDCPPCWTKSSSLAWDCYAFNDTDTKTCTFSAYKDVSVLLAQLGEQSKDQPNTPKPKKTVTVIVYQTVSADNFDSATALSRSYLLLVVFLFILFC